MNDPSGYARDARSCSLKFRDTLPARKIRKLTFGIPLKLPSANTLEKSFRSFACPVRAICLRSEISIQCREHRRGFRGRLSVPWPRREPHLFSATDSLSDEGFTNGDAEGRMGRGAHVKNRDGRRLSKRPMLMRTRILIYILCEAPLDLRL